MHHELHFVLPAPTYSPLYGKSRSLWEYHSIGIHLSVDKCKHLYEQLVHSYLNCFILVTNTDANVYKHQSMSMLCYMYIAHTALDQRVLMFSFRGLLDIFVVNYWQRTF